MLYNLLYLVPKNWLSRAVGRAVERQWPLGLHRVIRDALIRQFKPDVAEAEWPLDRYPTWQAFFTRRLKPGARPLDAAALVCPVDGMLTSRGRIAPSGEARLGQIKGIDYSLRDLLAGWDAAPYAGGAYLTVYLAPWNYHRIHAPAAAAVTRARHVPGALWPVNAWSVGHIKGLFAVNDRVLVEMATAGEASGRMTIALVGATNVGRTTLAFSDIRGNAGNAPGTSRDFVPPAPLPLQKGGDLACFEMGSTIVLVLDAAWAARLRPGLLDESTPTPVRLGQGLST